MRAKLASSGMLIATLLLAACDDGSPDVKIEDVDVFLARICELGAQCPDISATQEELDACPLEIRSKLSGAGLTELGRFTTYTKSQQDCALECIGRAICDRFGEALSNMSDSDVLEPFRECEQECL